MKGYVEAAAGHKASDVFGLNSDEAVLAFDGNNDTEEEEAFPYQAPQIPAAPAIAKYDSIRRDPSNSHTSSYILLSICSRPWNFSLDILNLLCIFTPTTPETVAATTKFRILSPLRFLY